jgi:DNA-directed RNA polymerase specialized sigma24 family protein
MANEQPPSALGPAVEDHDAQWRELFARARGGDREAWDTLYRRYGEAVLRVIRHNFLPPRARLRREFDSDDLRQETFRCMFEAVCKGRRFASEHQFLVYMLKLARSQFGAYRRKRIVAQKRTLTREEPLDERRHGNLSRGDDPAFEAEVVEAFRKGGEKTASTRSR